jgi:hypothetical protein
MYKNILAIGATGDSSQASIGGSVSVYSISEVEDSTDDYSQHSSKIEKMTVIYPSNLHAHAYFGRSVSFRANIGLVSAYNEDGSGVVYVYEAEAESDWTEVAHFKALDSHSFDNFGGSSAIITSETSSSMVVMIGASGDNSRGSMAGAVYAFSKGEKNSKWSALGKMYGNTTQSHDSYGCTLQALGNTVFVGAELADGNVARSGVVFIEANVVPYFTGLQEDIDDKDDEDSTNHGPRTSSAHSVNVVVALLASILPAVALTALVTYRAVKLRTRAIDRSADPKLLPISRKPSSKRSSRSNSREQPFSLVLEEGLQEEDAPENRYPDLTLRDPRKYAMAAGSETAALQEEGSLPIHISV